MGYNSKEARDKSGKWTAQGHYDAANASAKAAKNVPEGLEGYDKKHFVGGMNMVTSGHGAMASFHTASSATEKGKLLEHVKGSIQDAHTAARALDKSGQGEAADRLREHIKGLEEGHKQAREGTSKAKGDGRWTAEGHIQAVKDAQGSAPDHLQGTDRNAFTKGMNNVKYGHNALGLHLDSNHHGEQGKLINRAKQHIDNAHESIKHLEKAGHQEDADTIRSHLKGLEQAHEAAKQAHDGATTAGLKTSGTFSAKDHDNILSRLHSSEADGHIDKAGEDDQGDLHTLLGHLDSAHTFLGGLHRGHYVDSNAKNAGSSLAAAARVVKGMRESGAHVPPMFEQALKGGVESLKQVTGKGEPEASPKPVKTKPLTQKELAAHGKKIAEEAKAKQDKIYTEAGALEAQKAVQEKGEEKHQSLAAAHGEFAQAYKHADAVPSKAKLHLARAIDHLDKFESQANRNNDGDVHEPAVDDEYSKAHQSVGYLSSKIRRVTAPQAPSAKVPKPQAVQPKPEKPKLDTTVSDFHEAERGKADSSAQQHDEGVDDESVSKAGQWRMLATAHANLSAAHDPSRPQADREKFKKVAEKSLSDFEKDNRTRASDPVTLSHPEMQESYAAVQKGLGRSSSSEEKPAVQHAQEAQSALDKGDRLSAHISAYQGLQAAAHEAAKAGNHDQAHEHLNKLEKVAGALRAAAHHAGKRGDTETVAKAKEHAKLAAQAVTSGRKALKDLGK